MDKEKKELNQRTESQQTTNNFRLQQEGGRIHFVKELEHQTNEIVSKMRTMEIHVDNKHMLAQKNSIAENAIKKCKYFANFSDIERLKEPIDINRNMNYTSQIEGIKSVEYGYLSIDDINPEFPWNNAEIITIVTAKGKDIDIKEFAYIGDSKYQEINQDKIVDLSYIIKEIESLKLPLTQLPTEVIKGISRKPEKSYVNKYTDENGNTTEVIFDKENYSILKTSSNKTTTIIEKSGNFAPMAEYFCEYAQPDELTRQYVNLTGLPYISRFKDDEMNEIIANRIKIAKKDIKYIGSALSNPYITSLERYTNNENQELREIKKVNCIYESYEDYVNSKTPEMILVKTMGSEHSHCEMYRKMPNGRYIINSTFRPDGIRHYTFDTANIEEIKKKIGMSIELSPEINQAIRTGNPPTRKNTVVKTIELIEDEGR